MNTCTYTETVVCAVTVQVVLVSSTLPGRHPNTLYLNTEFTLFMSESHILFASTQMIQYFQTGTVHKND